MVIYSCIDQLHQDIFLMFISFSECSGVCKTQMLYECDIYFFCGKFFHDINI